MMKRIAIAALMALALLPMAEARCLVVTLKSGQRMAFELGGTQNLAMTHDEGHLTFGTTTFDRTELQEFRIYAQRPDDAIAVGITDTGAPAAAADATAYDLSGRSIQQPTARLRPGLYIINTKKVIVR